MYCVTNDAPTFAVSRDGAAICHRCRADLGTESARIKHPDFRPLQPDYVADRVSAQYEANLEALRRVSILWKYGIHGDDANGWVDIEFKDLVTAAAFVQVLPGGVQALATFRTSPYATFAFRGATVVVTFPVPDDQGLF